MAKKAYRKPGGITGWLVTWEHTGDHAVPPCRIAAILNSRSPAERVRNEVELLYVNSRSLPAERIAYAKDRRSSRYPAEFDQIDGVPWEGRIRCGPNPHLYARLVDNLVAGGDGWDEAQVAWNERPGPDCEEIAKLFGKKEET